MKQPLCTLALAIALAIVVTGPACKDKAKDRPAIGNGVVDVDKDDAAMNQAIAAARAHLDVFTRELRAGGEGRRFAIKKGFPFGADGREHMWLGDVTAVAGGLEGKLDNEPRDATQFKVGERYLVATDEVSDWLITDSQGRMWGGYTIRALLPSMSAEERTQVEALLQPLP